MTRSAYKRWFTAGVRVEQAVDWAAHPAAHDAVGLVATIGPEVVGHGVLVLDGAGSGEVAFEVERAWRHHGVASALLRWLERIARARGLARIGATVLIENTPMLAVFREHGRFRERHAGGAVEFELPLGPR